MRKMILCMLFTTSLFACKRKWTAKDRSDFYAGCISHATIDKEIKDAKAYCSCLLQKVVVKYPNANDAKYMKYDTSVLQLARDCRK
jgi:hypothetical protein